MTAQAQLFQSQDRRSPKSTHQSLPYRQISLYFRSLLRSLLDLAVRVSEVVEKLLDKKAQPHLGKTVDGWRKALWKTILLDFHEESASLLEINRRIVYILLTMFIGVPIIMHKKY